MPTRRRALALAGGALAALTGCLQERDGSDAPTDGPADSPTPTPTPPPAGTPTVTGTDRPDPTDRAMRTARHSEPDRVTRVE